MSRSQALNEEHAGEGDPSETQRRKGLPLSGSCREPPKTSAYQLYTLYRDRHGTVQQVGVSVSSLSYEDEPRNELFTGQTL